MHDGKVFKEGTKNTYIGTSKNVLVVEMYLKGRWKNNFCISEGVIKWLKKNIRYLNWVMAKKK